MHPGASSAFVLTASDRTLLIGVNSHSVLSWFASFQEFTGGGFLRFLDPWTSVASGAFFRGHSGAWSFVYYVPAQTIRIETSAAVTATTSFSIVEVVGR